MHPDAMCHARDPSLQRLEHTIHLSPTLWQEWLEPPAKVVSLGLLLTLVPTITAIDRYACR